MPKGAQHKSGVVVVFVVLGKSSVLLKMRSGRGVNRCEANGYIPLGGGTALCTASRVALSAARQGQCPPRRSAAAAAAAVLLQVGPFLLASLQFAGPGTSGWAG